ncbi:MAG TPA: hypothetical protein VFT31_11700 [Kribbella sp.]|nr:hypothetical protein [Kribbella sp.]
MSEQQTERRQVQVWFGKHVIASYVADPEHAERYAAAMDKRYAGLKITNEPVPLPTPAELQPIPSDRLWGTVAPH